LGQGVVELKANAPGGLRKIRCPYCQKLAVPGFNKHNKPVVKCTCGRQFSVQTL
jgi:hypothetical protein